MSKELILQEQQRTENVALTPPQADAIRAIAGVTISPSMRGNGLYDINPGSMVGTLELDGLSLEIVPKVPVNHLLFLVAYSADPKTWRDTYSTFTSSTYWHESLIQSFLSLVNKVIVRGLMIGYRQEEESLPTIRGRILFDKLIKANAGTLFPIQLQFDEFTEDIEVNRVIRSALHVATSIRLRNALPQKQISSILREFSQVRLTTYDQRNMPSFAFVSMSRDYRLAILTALLILKHYSIERGGDEIQARSFLLDMNLLFQDFVTTALREALHVSERNFPGRQFDKELSLDQDNTIRLKPDLSWWSGRRCEFVGDVKYKKSEANQDYYQLLAYLTATNLNWGMLVYPDGEAQTQSYTIKSEHRRISTETVDLNKDPDEILANIQTLADVIATHRRAAR